MTTLQAFFLGVLQGATEFLPISSSGHLVLVPWLLGWGTTTLAFGAAVHLGTLIAVVVYFWRDLWRVFLSWLRSLMGKATDPPAAKLGWLIIIGTVPGMLAGLFLEDWFESMFASPLTVSLFLLVTGFLLFFSERMGKQTKEITAISWLDALLVGIGQAVAVAPGISRSGATMAAGLTRNVSRPEAARFSFLLGTPIIAGAGAMEVGKFILTADKSGLFLALIGGITAAVVGFLAISGLLRYLRDHSIAVFAYYCWAFGGLCLLLALLRG